MSDILSIEVLDELITDISEQLSKDEVLARTLININRKGKMEEFLELLGMTELLRPKSTYSPYKNGKILVIGQSDVAEDKMIMTAAKMGIDKNRLELHLNYEDAKTYDFNKTQWNPNYSLIVVGPQGHSGVGKEDYGSVISRIEQEEGFPPVLRATRDATLRNISKSIFKELLQLAINNGWIERNTLN